MESLIYISYIYFINVSVFADLKTEIEWIYLKYLSFIDKLNIKCKKFNGDTSLYWTANKLINALTII